MLSLLAFNQNHNLTLTIINMTPTHQSSYPPLGKKWNLCISKNVKVLIEVIAETWEQSHIATAVCDVAEEPASRNKNNLTENKFSITY